MAYGSIIGQTSEGFSKDEILTSSTANKFGLSDAAVPNDVFDFLGKFNQHWWRRRRNQAIINGYSLTVDINSGVENYNYIGASGDEQSTYSIQYSESVGVDSEGAVYLVNPKTVSGSYNDPTPFEILSGKYFLPYYLASHNTTKIQYAEPNQKPVKRGGTFSGNYYLYFPKIKTEFYLAQKWSDWEYMTSPDRSAYPDNSEKGGYIYEYLGIPYDNIKATPRISIGYYNGTDKYGKDFPNRITFDFKPLFLCLYKSNFGSDAVITLQDKYSDFCDFMFMLPVWNSESFEMKGYKSNYLMNTAKWVDNTTLEWYAESSSSDQYNSKGVYYYIAIG